MEKENLRIVSEAFGGLINDHHIEAIDEYWAEDYVEHNPMIGRDRKAFKEFVKGWLAAIPDLSWDPILAPVASYDQVWTYGRYSGTFSNDWMGMPANGKQVDFTAMDVIRVEDGKIVEHWDVMDLKTLFDQMKG